MHRTRARGQRGEISGGAPKRPGPPPQATPSGQHSAKARASLGGTPASPSPAKGRASLGGSPALPSDSGGRASLGGSPVSPSADLVIPERRQSAKVLEGPLRPTLRGSGDRFDAPNTGTFAERRCR